jgi:hypothetical protein
MTCPTRKIAGWAALGRLGKNQSLSLPNHHLPSVGGGVVGQGVAGALARLGTFRGWAAPERYARGR